jgi:hypothetical protein
MERRSQGCSAKPYGFRRDAAPAVDPFASLGRMSNDVPLM